MARIILTENQFKRLLLREAIGDTVYYLLSFQYDDKEKEISVIQVPMRSLASLHHEYINGEYPYNTFRLYRVMDNGQNVMPYIRNGELTAIVPNAFELDNCGRLKDGTNLYQNQKITAADYIYLMDDGDPDIGGTTYEQGSPFFLGSTYVKQQDSDDNETENQSHVQSQNDNDDFEPYDTPINPYEEEPEYINPEIEIQPPQEDDKPLEPDEDIQNGEDGEEQDNEENNAPEPNEGAYRGFYYVFQYVPRRESHISKGRVVTRVSVKNINNELYAQGSYIVLYNPEADKIKNADVVQLNRELLMNKSSLTDGKDGPSEGKEIYDSKIPSDPYHKRWENNRNKGQGGKKQSAEFGSDYRQLPTQSLGDKFENAIDNMGPLNTNLGQIIANNIRNGYRVGKNTYHSIADR